MIDHKKLIACKECGLILEKPHLDLQHQFNCPRCNGVIYRFGQNHTLIIILAVTTLILFFPSVFLPIMTLEILEIKQTTSLLETVFVFSNDGYLLLSVFVTFIGILIPFLMLILMLLILIPLNNGANPKTVSNYFRWYESLFEWQMAEVFMISIFIAIIKLQKMAQLQLEIGFYFFIAFLFFMFVTMVLFNPYEIWSEDEVSN